MFRLLQHDFQEPIVLKVQRPPVFMKVPPPTPHPRSGNETAISFWKTEQFWLSVLLSGKCVAIICEMTESSIFSNLQSLSTFVMVYSFKLSCVLSLTKAFIEIYLVFACKFFNILIMLVRKQQCSVIVTPHSLKPTHLGTMSCSRGFV